MQKTIENSRKLSRTPCIFRALSGENNICVREAGEKKWRKFEFVSVIVKGM
jgi:hypothetical protein